MQFIGTVFLFVGSLSYHSNICAYVHCNSLELDMSLFWLTQDTRGQTLHVTNWSWRSQIAFSCFVKLFVRFSPPRWLRIIIFVSNIKRLSGSVGTGMCLTPRRSDFAKTTRDRIGYPGSWSQGPGVQQVNAGTGRPPQ